MNLTPSLADQQQALRTGRGWLPLTGATELLLQGRDRASFLHNFCTGDIKALRPGQGCEAFFLNAKGTTLGHGMVFCFEEHLAISGAPGQGERLREHLDRYLIREDVEIVDRSANSTVWLLGGAAWQADVDRWAGRELPAIGDCAAGQIAGRAVELRRTPHLAAGSWLVLDRAGPQQPPRESSDDSGARPSLEVSLETFHTERIETGFPWFGLDIVENLPQEVDRNDVAISFKKGCYLGQETVARIDALGHVNRLLRRLSTTRLANREEQPLKAGDELRHGDKVAGTITSAAWSPAEQRHIALGYVRREHAAPGTELQAPSGSVTVR